MGHARSDALIGESSKPASGDTNQGHRRTRALPLGEPVIVIAGVALIGNY
jgi:hypothetical protein